LKGRKKWHRRARGKARREDEMVVGDSKERNNNIIRKYPSPPWRYVDEKMAQYTNWHTYTKIIIIIKMRKQRDTIDSLH
jgi:hypothetical protein